MTTLSMEQILLFVIAGFIAQIIDGTLGMAYGISATSLMLAFGVPPASASASVHAAEVITTGISTAGFPIKEMSKGHRWEVSDEERDGLVTYLRGLEPRGFE